MNITLITNSAAGRTARPYNLSVPGAALEVLAKLAEAGDDYYVSARLTSDMACCVPVETIQEWTVPVATDAVAIGGAR